MNPSFKHVSFGKVLLKAQVLVFLRFILHFRDIFDLQIAQQAVVLDSYVDKGLPNFSNNTIKQSILSKEELVLLA